MDSNKALSLHKMAQEALSFRKMALRTFNPPDYSRYTINIPKFTYTQDYMNSVKNLYSTIGYYKEIHSSLNANFINLKNILNQQQELFDSIRKINNNQLDYAMSFEYSTDFKHLAQNIVEELEQIEFAEELNPQYEDLNTEISSNNWLTLDQTLAIIGIILAILALIQTQFVSQQSNPQLDRIESLLQQMVEIQSTQLELLSTDISE